MAFVILGGKVVLGGGGCKLGCQHVSCVQRRWDVPSEKGSGSGVVGIDRVQGTKQNPPIFV